MSPRAVRLAFRSGYRIMWMLTMFDLPVTSKKQRKEATRFRNDLLKLGFEMAQFSVYLRCCPSREHTDALSGKVRQALPSGGKVSILVFTDRQYAAMLHFQARKPDKPGDKGQLLLF